MDSGLEKIVAAETVLSHIDGQQGSLVVRGQNIEYLAATTTFEDVTHLLWSGFFEDLPDVPQLTARLAHHRVSEFEKLQGDFGRLCGLTPMEALRAGLALAPDGNTLDVALSLLARAAVTLAATSRLRQGLEPIAPNPNHRHAEDLVAMVNDGRTNEALSRALDAYLVTVAEHGLNASTFAARVVASTRSGLASAVVSGLSALKGPLHGGAPGPVLDMLDAIGTADKAECWIESALGRGERLMGFGHRVYRVRDPRADALKQALKKLPKSAGRVALAETIEQEILRKLKAAKPDRVLDTNVEYYTAILLEALGFERDAFVCVFGCARIAGWVAHAREQLATRRIVRPRSIYVGPQAA